jgi:hypothetical protein
MQQQEYLRIAIWPKTYRRIKIMSALAGRSIVEYLDELVPHPQPTPEIEVEPLHPDAARSNDRVRARVARRR